MCNVLASSQSLVASMIMDHNSGGKTVRDFLEPVLKSTWLRAVSITSSKASQLVTFFLSFSNVHSNGCRTCIQFHFLFIFVVGISMQHLGQVVGVDGSQNQQVSPLTQIKRLFLDVDRISGRLDVGARHIRNGETVVGSGDEAAIRAVRPRRHGLSCLYVGHSNGASCHLGRLVGIRGRSSCDEKHMRLVKKAKGAYSRPFLYDSWRDESEMMYRLLSQVLAWLPDRVVDMLVLSNRPAITRGRFRLSLSTTAISRPIAGQDPDHRRPSPISLATALFPLSPYLDIEIGLVFNQTIHQLNLPSKRDQFSDSNDKPVGSVFSYAMSSVLLGCADISGSITRSQLTIFSPRGIHIELVTVQPLLLEVANSEGLDQESGRLSICRDISRRN
ncbi:hypothetical protein KCV03_g169, partial [Aureobasidium melanogenum]